MLKDKLLKETAYGSFLGFPSPVIVDLMAYAKYDFVIFDVEHGNFTNADLENCARAAKANGLPYIMRLPCADQGAIQKALDLGADGVLVSMVNDGETAQKVCNAALYAPDGSRGFSTHTVAGNYGYADDGEFFQNADNVIVGVQIETKEGLENLDEILAVEKTNMIFVGPADLSVSCNFESMVCEEAIKTYKYIIEKTLEAGKIPGILAFNNEMKEIVRDLGFRFLPSTVIGTISEAFEMDIARARS